MTTIRRLPLVAAITAAFATSASAQALATYGAVEAAGLGESSALLGASVSSGNLGVSPVLSVSGQTYRFRSGNGTFTNAYAVSPALGLQYNSGRSLMQGSVGYTFVSTDLPAGFAPVGLESGGENSMFVMGQANYWGDGNSDVQAIASYAIEPKYLWSRFRAARRIGISPIFFGGEAVAQGSSKNATTTGTIGTGTTTTKSNYRFNFGPTIQYRYTENFRVGASAGIRTGGNPSVSSGYVRIEFLALSRLGMM